MVGVRSHSRKRHIIVNECLKRLPCVGVGRCDRCCFGTLPKRPLTGQCTCLSAVRIRCRWLTAGLPLEHCPWLTMTCPTRKVTPYLSTMGTMTSSPTMMSDQGCIVQRLSLCHACLLPGITHPCPPTFFAGFSFPESTAPTFLSQLLFLKNPTQGSCISTNSSHTDSHSNSSG